VNHMSSHTVRRSRVCIHETLNWNCSDILTIQDSETLPLVSYTLRSVIIRQPHGLSHTMPVWVAITDVPVYMCEQGGGGRGGSGGGWGRITGVGNLVRRADTHVFFW
jgi:hypothetical protein